MCCSSWLVLLSQVGSSDPDRKQCIATLAFNVDKLRDEHTRSLRHGSYDWHMRTTHTLFKLPFVWPSIVRDAAVYHHLRLFHMSLSYYFQRQIPQPILDILDTRYDVHCRAEQLLYNKVRTLTVYKFKCSQNIHSRRKTPFGTSEQIILEFST